MVDPSFAAGIAARAIKAGASASEVLVRESTEFSASVRGGEVETLAESASKALGLRVMVDGRQASVSTSDMAEGALDRLVLEAIDLARIASIDEATDLPDAGSYAADRPDLDLYDASLDELSATDRVDLALRAERAANDVDSRIVNVDRGGIETTSTRTVFANSGGFEGAYRATTIALTVVPVAQGDGQMQRDYASDVRRFATDLEDPEALGRRAAEAALRKLGARKIASGEAPVIFAPRVSRDLVGLLLQAGSGEAIVRKASFLVDRIGERVAAPAVTVVDDGRLTRGIGSRPFDGEGLGTRQTTVIHDGILESYLLNTYTARKLGGRPTGNAVRGLVGQPGVGAGNMSLAAGGRTVEEMIRSIDRGFLVTEVIGFGVNVVNGDYSRGAAGLWIEGGEIAFPVHEVTIAGNLKRMLAGITAVGDDLEFRGRFGAPSVMIDSMVISGQ